MKQSEVTAIVYQTLSETGFCNREQAVFKAKASYTEPIQLNACSHFPSPESIIICLNL